MTFKRPHLSPKIKLILLMLPSLVITLFLLVSSYEVAFSQDVPLITSNQEYSASRVIDQIVNQQDQIIDQSIIIRYHQPRQIRLVNISEKLEIIPAINQGNYWLQRANKGHYLVFNEFSESGLGNTVIYTQESWRTLTNPYQIKSGEYVKVDTEEYSNTYQVVEVLGKQTGESYLLDQLEKPYLLLIVADPQNTVNYFIKAKFVSQEKYT